MNWKNFFTRFGQWGMRYLPAFEKTESGRLFYIRGLRFPAWFAMAIPFMIFIIIFVEHSKELRRTISWKALACSIALFEFVLFPIEHLGVNQGFWIYNRARILGIEIWDIPIEEPLIYYLFPVIMVVFLWQLLFNRFEERYICYWTSVLLLIPITIAFEYLALWMDIWSFSENASKLWGISFWGAPIEEFLFWFGAPPFVLSIYFWFERTLSKRKTND